MTRSVDLGNPFLKDLSGVCELLLVRHGEQAYTPNMILADGVDAPLSELGEQQAAAVGERLSSTPLAHVYASPLQRARDTGRAIASHHNMEVAERDELQEINFFAQLPQDQGLLDSVGADELRDIYRAANRTNRWDAYPHSEDVPAFRRRIVETMDALLAAHVGDRIVVACHGGVINTWLAHLFGASHDRVCTIHHTSITTVRGAADRRAVVQVNDYAHVLPIQTELNPDNAS